MAVKLRRLRSTWHPLINTHIERPLDKETPGQRLTVKANTQPLQLRCRHISLDLPATCMPISVPVERHDTRKRGREHARDHSHYHQDCVDDDFSCLVKKEIGKYRPRTTMKAHVPSRMMTSTMELVRSPLFILVGIAPSVSATSNMWNKRPQILYHRLQLKHRYGYTDM